MAHRTIWGVGIVLVFALAGCGSPRYPASAGGHSTLPRAEVPLSSKAGTVSPSPLALDGITMVTSQDGWGLASGEVVVTHDEGRTWRKVTPPGFPMISTRLFSLGSIASAFPTAHDSIIAQERASTIRVWRTTDSGVHWTVATWKAPKTVRLRYFFEGSLLMQFMNTADGLLIFSAAGNPGSNSDALLVTTDGGIHWHLVHPMPKISAPYLGQTPTSALGDIGGLALSPSGWGMASINTMLMGKAWVLTTTNGGRSWSSRTLPMPPGSADDSVFEGPQANQGVESAWLWLILVNNHHPNQQQWFLDHTTDGGLHWTRIPWTQAIPQSSTLGGVYLWPLGQRVLLLMADPHGTEIWRWTSHDTAWNRVAHLPLEKIASVSLLPNGDGWVIGETGSYQTTNGGATWQSFSPMLN